MKFISFFLFFLLSFSLYAQQPGKTNQRRVSPAYRVSNFNQQVQLKEAELNKALNQFNDAHKSLQPVLKDKVENLLYDLFDLNLQYNEEEARLLGDKILELEKDESLSEKSDEIQDYKSRLRKVETSLQFRRENRDRIVNQRLAELLQ